MISRLIYSNGKKLQFPFCSTAIFKVFNRLDFMGLQRQDVCLQSNVFVPYVQDSVSCF